MKSIVQIDDNKDNRLALFGRNLKEAGSGSPTGRLRIVVTQYHGERSSVVSIR
jgi:hypothetical protein